MQRNSPAGCSVFRLGKQIHVRTLFEGNRRANEDNKTWIATSNGQFVEQGQRSEMRRRCGNMYLELVRLEKRGGIFDVCNVGRNRVINALNAFHGGAT